VVAATINAATAESRSKILSRFIQSPFELIFNSGAATIAALDDGKFGAMELQLALELTHRPGDHLSCVERPILASIAENK